MAPPKGQPTDRAARVTAREVAALAGVSLGTVSNVMNRPDKVAPETLRRVKEASERLGWTLHQGAKQMRGGRSAAIGAVVAQQNPHTIELIEVVEQVLDENGFVLQFATSAYQPDREMKRVELFEQQRVRGIIISPTQDYEAHLPRLRQLDIPLVMLGPASYGLCFGVRRRCRRRSAGRSSPDRERSPTHSRGRRRRPERPGAGTHLRGAPGADV